MSGETLRHVRLVEALVDVVQRRHAVPKGIIVLADHHHFGVNRPPQLGGFTPDVFAHDLPTTFRVVGEAKTADDIENERSARQLAAFLNHLSLYPNSTMYIAVPWDVGPRARALLRSLYRPVHKQIAVEVLSIYVG